VAISLKQTRKIIFLDKDGTLVENVPYNVDPAKIRLTQGAASGLCKLAAHGYAFVVISNQCGVAKGFFTEAALVPVKAYLQRLFAGLGAELLGFYYCPHHPDGERAGYAYRCTCRKPAPGLLHQAALAHDVDLGRSWMIGDILDDVEAGRRAGCLTLLLDNGHETEWRSGPFRTPDLIARDLSVAADCIVAATHLQRQHEPPLDLRQSRQ